MGIGGVPPADVSAEPWRVRALLQEQHPDLGGLPLADVGSGWDNRIYRLGDHLSVRLPRRAASSHLIEHEQRWLPQLASRLPLPVPTPLRIGRPGCGFPYSWSVTPWLSGRSAATTPPEDPHAAAVTLGAFVRAVHQRAPEDAPRNPVRGVPLAYRTNAVHERLTQLQDVIDVRAVHAQWSRAVRMPPWTGPPLWIHGDLHPGNLLVTGGRISAVIDFGDLTAGDPATDLSIAWTLLPARARSTFQALAAESSRWIDANAWERARGWALIIGLALLASSRDDDTMRVVGRTSIDAVLGEK